MAVKKTQAEINKEARLIVAALAKEDAYFYYDQVTVDGKPYTVHVPVPRFMRLRDRARSLSPHLKRK